MIPVAAGLVATWLAAATAAASDDTFLAALEADRRPLVVQALPATPATLRTTLDDSLAAPRDPAQIWAARQWHNAMEPALSRFVQDPALRTELLQRIYLEARLAGLPPALVLAVIQVESAFRADAVSSAGAVGLMQIMPFWIRELGLPADDLKDPWRNLRYGTTILAHYLAVERGDFTRALARYNGSLGKTWYPERVMRAWQRHWREPTGAGRATVQR
ncbi:soluble lytic murein transglycosylase-like protein [Halomonas campaniensis]|uniref:Soluble lytic murein transglycosylase-like protein n=1 Tax=Halomonas campaniensis TaxID=213554 RepID=A0A7W5K581_9GAMM|nr:soluble lytic murein transglycosylase-like protein [Halomonas campaniensis]